MADTFSQRFFGEPSSQGQFASANPPEVPDNESQSLRRVMTMASKLAPNGLPWQDWRQSDNVEQGSGDRGANLLKMYSQEDQMQRQLMRSMEPGDQLAQAKAILQRHLDQSSPQPSRLQQIIRGILGGPPSDNQATGPVSNLGIRG